MQLEDYLNNHLSFSNEEESPISAEQIIIILGALNIGIPDFLRYEVEGIIEDGAVTFISIGLDGIENRKDAMDTQLWLEDRFKVLIPNDKVNRMVVSGKIRGHNFTDK